MQWQQWVPEQFALGEGPFWDTRTASLFWVDIIGRRACRCVNGSLQAWQLPEVVSAFIPTQAGDALVTLPSGVYRLDLQSPSDLPALRLFCVADTVAGNRPNEARCDPEGNLWLGSMQNNIAEDGSDLPVERRSGGLFRIDPEGNVATLTTGLGIANTLLWTDDGDVLFSDTLDGVIYAAQVHHGVDLGPQRIWAKTHERGAPDGSAMDAEGYVWNARWGGGCVLRFAPDGSLDRVVELPVTYPTSCVFGGPDLTQLFVTSARPGGATGALDGCVLVTELDVPGRHCHRFAG
ncbi:SMP-30/gluconolactonase/LRE family protein [Pseudomonas matsuisoli]|uniref:Senescence marker protein-30 n=1 Tax=Pseudomonas matsuisoli TaxID=1515666 RepID=A0A917PR06_9PSED|nr:SMP-30/gluconolactonase/LRE family protein [Pseudomonas matsuisoli]GGJ88088.1 senescence marker protein-30 [Pseudomonas matsuisoli]